MKKKKTQTIFLDSGGRWKKVKVTSRIISILLFILVVVFFIAYFYSPYNNDSNYSNNFLDYAIEDINNNTRPVIDQGTFIKLNTSYDMPYLQKFGEDKKIAVLTFDDGPDPQYTPQILEILEKEKVKGTFFVVGSQIYKHSEIGQDILDQGSDMGLHTFSHYENIEDKKLTSLDFITELDFTEKIFSHFYGYESVLFRIPYLGMEDELSYNSLQYVREGLKRGLTISVPTVDADDWAFSDNYLRVIDQATHANVQTAVILFHDAGGDRNATIKALPQVIKHYKDRGYTFKTVSELAIENGLPYKNNLSISDKFTSALVFQFYDIYKQSPKLFEKGFYVGFYFVLLHMGIILVLVLIQKVKSIRSKKSHPKSLRLLKQNELISVIIPAYNEELSIKQTVLSILKSEYKNFELILVDDGSKDQTLENMQSCTFDERVKVISKVNGGKCSALNLGVSQAVGKIIIFLDADTRVAPNAFSEILKIFSDKKVGAVAGTIFVGNNDNFITNLQSMEYIISQSIEKRVYDLFGYVTIVPGAFGAWRTNIIKKIGGFSEDTLAEDFDLSLQLLKTGYLIRYCDSAIAYTEAPSTFNQFFTQRFRWNFGNLQVYFKNRDLIFDKKYGILGIFLLPRAVYIQIPSLILTPLIDILVLLNLFFGETILTLFFLLFYFILHTFITLIAYFLLKVRMVNPILVMFLRFPFAQMLYLIFFSAIIGALKGELIAWSKLNHTGKLSLEDSAT